MVLGGGIMSRKQKERSSQRFHIDRSEALSKSMENRFIRAYEKYGDHSALVLLAFYRGQYWKFLLSTLFFVIKHAPALFSGLLTANVINAVLAGGDEGRRAVFLNVGIWLALLAVHIPANYVHTRLRAQVTRGTEAGIRGALVRKFQELSIPYFTKTQSGRLQSKVMRDVEQVEVLSSQLLVNLMNIAVSLVITLGITAAKSRETFLIFLLVTPIASCTIVAFRKRIHEENRAFRQEIESTSARVMEMVEMIPVTRAHALEDHEIAKVSEYLDDTSEKGFRLDMVQSMFGAVSWSVFQVFQALCLLYTGLMAFHGRIQVGDITFYQNSFTTVVNQISALINLLPILTKGLESVTSIGEVLTSQDVEDQEDKREITHLDGRFDFERVTFAYRGSRELVLKEFNLHVRPGEVIALVGASGAGKTTVLNLLIGFLRPSTGRLLIDGNDSRDINMRSYRRFLAVVPQTPMLFSGTIRENIVYGMDEASDEDVDRVVRAANLQEVIDKLPDGIQTQVAEHGSNLSGGQRQRIAIARAMIRNPRVIFLDEATSALDTVSESEIQKALANLIRGRTTFVVAHRLSTIRGADRILVLDQGQVAEEGSYGELMQKKGRFYQMEKMQGGEE